jgi:hypothetical protein
MINEILDEETLYRIIICVEGFKKPRFYAENGARFYHTPKLAACP